MGTPRPSRAVKSLLTGMQLSLQASIRTWPVDGERGRIDAGGELDRRVPGDVAVVLFDRQTDPGFVVDARRRFGLASETGPRGDTAATG